MAVQSIPTNFVDGDKPTAAQVNAWGKFMEGLMANAAVDDNDGDPIFPLSIDYPVPVKLGAVNEECKVLAGGATYTVPSGKLLVVRNLFHPASAVADQITPSGGSAFNLITGSTQRIRNGRCIVLGPGDAITLGIGSFGCANLMDLPTGISTLCKRINNVTSHTVATNDRLILTEALADTTNSLTLTVDGANAAEAPGLEHADGYQAFSSLVVKQAQVLGNGSAVFMLVTGITLSIA